MYIIYLAGNSLKNKNWIEQVKENFDLFSSGEILYYDHWQTGEEWANLSVESKKLSKLVENKNDYFIFAKSIGSVLTLKCVYEKIINPKKIIICGHPYNAAVNAGHPINDYLKSLSIPTTFIQNEFDHYFSCADLESILKQFPPKNYTLIKNPGINTHDYEDYENLSKITKEFFK